MKHFIALLIALMLIVPAVSGAQDIPSYAQAGGGDEQIRGRVVAFDGHYSLTVRDEKGYVDHVTLHEGTIINPTGLTLASGMIVSVLGYNAGSYFSANEIDTPYTYDGDVPYYLGHPWFYYGVGVSLGFFFGNVGWWHGAAFGGGFRFAGGARVYTHVNVGNLYRAHSGVFHGRDFVAPRTGGGYHAGGHFGGGRGHGHH